jgi:hypothetical protein
MVMAVGVVMGLHAAYEIFVGGTEISMDIILTYLPVSMLYIASMAMGYWGLRYIELSISSPICNSSGALVAVMTLIMVGFSEYSPLALGAVALVCVGAIGLGVVDYFEDEGLRAERQKESNYKYSKSLIALALPVAYCILDAVGTFADNRVLEVLDEGSANAAYELTFLFVGIICFVLPIISLFLAIFLAILSVVIGSPSPSSNFPVAKTSLSPYSLKLESALGKYVEPFSTILFNCSFVNIIIFLDISLKYYYSNINSSTSKKK